MSQEDNYNVGPGSGDTNIKSIMFTVDTVDSLIIIINKNLGNKNE